MYYYIKYIRQINCFTRWEEYAYFIDEDSMIKYAEYFKATFEDPEVVWIDSTGKACVNKYGMITTE